MAMLAATFAVYARLTLAARRPLCCVHISRACGDFARMGNFCLRLDCNRHLAPISLGLRRTRAPIGRMEEGHSIQLEVGPGLIGRGRI